MRDATSNARSDFTTGVASDAPEGDVELMGRGPLIEIFKFLMTTSEASDAPEGDVALMGRSPLTKIW